MQHRGNAHIVVDNNHPAYYKINHCDVLIMAHYIYSKLLSLPCKNVWEFHAAALNRRAVMGKFLKIPRMGVHQMSVEELFHIFCCMWLFLLKNVCV